MSGYEIASLTGIESMPVIGTLRWTPLRKHFGVTAFGISAYTATDVGQDGGRLSTGRSSSTPKLQALADEDEDLAPLRVAGES